MKNMKTFSALLALVVAGLFAEKCHAQTIIGTGSDFSYLVIEATDFGAPLVYEWHYTYDSSAPPKTVAMLHAIDAAVPELNFTIPSPDDNYLDAIEYLPANTNLQNTISLFWAQWVSGGTSGVPLLSKPFGVWSEGYGIAERELAPGSWDGFIYNGEFNPDPPYQITSPPPSVLPVPEARTIILVCVGIVAIFYVRKRLHTC